MSTDHDIAELRRNIRELQQLTKQIPVRFAHGGGGFKIPTKTTFPPIPNKLKLIYIEGQVWEAGPDDTYWHPIAIFTDTAGTPGSTP